MKWNMQEQFYLGGKISQHFFWLFGTDSILITSFSSQGPVNGSTQYSVVFLDSSSKLAVCCSKLSFGEDMRLFSLSLVETDNKWASHCWSRSSSLSDCYNTLRHKSYYRSSVAQTMLQLSKVCFMYQLQHDGDVNDTALVTGMLAFLF